jgi:hypothetical protein
MEGNKLKHSFVEKDVSTTNFLNEWLRLVHEQNHQQFIIEQSFRNYEDVIVSERVSNNLLSNNSEEYHNYVKQLLSNKLAKILLDEGFIDFSNHSGMYNDYTDFKMRIKAIRNPENNVR